MPCETLGDREASFVSRRRRTCGRSRMVQGRNEGIGALLPTKRHVCLSAPRDASRFMRYGADQEQDPIGVAGRGVPNGPN